MNLPDGVASSPPGPGSSLEQSLKYYKAQYETLESELADFQASSKELEAELEKDIDASEKREQKLKDKATNLQYEVDEWRAKHKQAKSEASSAQNILQKEITELRDTNRTLTLRLRDIEVANDDFERKQRNTESSLEDIESKYNQIIEKGVMLEEEVKVGEQEREGLRIEAQRLKDELSDLKIEADIVKDKLHKAEQSLARRSNTLSIDPPVVSPSPRSELSPTTTDASFDTPPAKTSSSGVSDTPTPPSPPISDKSAPSAKTPMPTPKIPKGRTSLNGNIPTPRQSTYGSRPIASSQPQPHTRGPSVPAISRTGRPSTYRQSLTNSHVKSAPVRSNLPQSQSILHLRNLRSKMQNLEARVQTARSKLPAPVNTPPRASPRSGSAMGNNASITPTPLSTTTTVPASVTVRSRKRNTGSTISGASTLPDSNPDPPDSTTPAPVVRNRPSRFSLTSQYSHAPRPPPSPTRPRSQAGPVSNDMPAPLSRPDSRTSRTSNIYSHSRPGSRASLSGFPRPNSVVGSYNASTDRVRPKSSLSNHGYDGTYDDDESILEGDESILEEDIRTNSSASNKDFSTPTPRRTTFSKRTSDVGTAIPTPNSKRTSISGRMPGLARRQSQQGFAFADAKPSLAKRQSQQSFKGGNDGMMRPPSRTVSRRDVNETF